MSGGLRPPILKFSFQVGDEKTYSLYVCLCLSRAELQLWNKKWKNLNLAEIFHVARCYFLGKRSMLRSGKGSEGR